MKVNKVVLAYSGGLDTSIIIKWLIDTYGCEVIAYAADVRDINTYEEISRVVPMRKCRIISEKDLKKQEFFYEKTANSQNN